MIPGFASAERAWENANPFDNDCTCEGGGFICRECGTVSDPKVCPEVDCIDGFMRDLTPEEVSEHFPSANCPQHGYTDEDAEDDAREHDIESRKGY